MIATKLKMLLWPWNRLNAVPVLRAWVNRKNPSTGQDSPQLNHPTMYVLVDWSSNSTTAAKTHSIQLFLIQKSKARDAKPSECDAVGLVGAWLWFREIDKAMESDG